MTQAQFLKSAAALQLNKLRRLKWTQWVQAAMRLRRLGLATQFMLMSSLTVVLAMLILGYWVTAQIQHGVVHSAAAAAALYSDSLIEPHVQELVAGSQLSPENRSQLDRLLSPQIAGKPVVAFKIWQGDTIVYSSRRELIGQRFPPNKERLRAWSGEVTATLGGLDQGDDDKAERLLQVPILEVHAPVRQSGSNRIIAVAETYEFAATLQQDLVDASIASGLVVVTVTLCMIALQFGIVMRGSHTIDSQRQALNDKIAAMTGLLADNEALRNRCHSANRRVTEINERFLRTLGANLHDGPVQLLSLTQLRLGCLQEVLRHISSNADAEIVRDAEDDFRVIIAAVTDSLDEIRNVAVGLAPPEIERLELDEALRMAASRHQRRVGKDVDCDIGKLPKNAPLTLKSCLYRFVQEGLNNAYRHAGGLGQLLMAQVVDRRIEVCVLDTGPGIAATQVFDGVGGQGLLLLRDRVISLGGLFEIKNRETGGVCLKASFELEPGHAAEYLTPPSAPTAECENCSEFERCSVDARLGRNQARECVSTS